MNKMVDLEDGSFEANLNEFLEILRETVLNLIFKMGNIKP